MKKIILSVFTICAFAAYVVYQRMGWGSSMLVVPQISNTDSTAPISGNLEILYRDGEYTGISADAFYGRVQVVAVIARGRIVDVKFLDYPQDQPTSVQVSGGAVPILRTEAIAAQSAEVDIVSGATQTSKAFRESLASALIQAKL
jgi:uncharacterized protein with FMN-binding domain